MKLTSPLVSVVIPSYNSLSLLKNSLKSLLKTKYSNFEVIIVDDCSIDGSFEYLQKNYLNHKKVLSVQNLKNQGPSRTRNNGIMLSRGKYVAFIETDMEVDPTWLQLLVSEMEADESLGAVQSKILDINKKGLIHSTGVLYDPHTFWVLSFACGLPQERINKKREVGTGSVGSLMKKDVLLQVGGFDEGIVHNIDDTELSWRMWLAGFRCVTVPEALTYHWTAKPGAVRGRVTPKLISEFHTHKTFRIFLKNYEIQSILRYTPWLLLAFTMRIIKNLLKGNINPLRGFIKSIVWNIQVLEDTLKERQKVQQSRKFTDRQMFERLGIKGNFFSIYMNYLNPNLKKVDRVFG